MQSPHLYSVALQKDQLFYEMFKQFLQSSLQVWIGPLCEFCTWNTDKMRWYFDSNLTLVRPCSQSTHEGQTFIFSVKWSIKICFLYWNNNVSEHQGTIVRTTCWKQDRKYSVLSFKKVNYFSMYCWKCFLLHKT